MYNKEKRRARYLEHKEENKIKRKEYLEKNKEKISSKQKEYEEKNVEQRKAYRKKYREINKEKIKEQSKEYKLKNKDRLKEQSKILSKIYRETHKEKIKKNLAEYRKEHKKELLDYANQYNLKKRKNDPLYHLKWLLRVRTRDAFRRNGFKKTSKTQELLGADFQIVKEHIEKQFTVGMCWELVGPKIHIDHIIPLASAQTEEERILIVQTFKNKRGGSDEEIKGGSLQTLFNMLKQNKSSVLERDRSVSSL